MHLRQKLKLELAESQRPLIYVSRPTHFGVDYTINPWMEGQIGNVNHEVAMLQWENLIQVLNRLTDVVMINCPDAKLPDVTFVANAGSFLPINGQYVFVPSSFKNVERQGERQFFIDALTGGNITVYLDKLTSFFEGDGDLLRLRDRLVIGYGHRTDKDFAYSLSTLIGTTDDLVIQLNLIDPRFYHLDTCFFYHNHKTTAGHQEDFCMYFPDAFSKQSRAQLRTILRDQRIQALELNESEALKMGCNAIGIGAAIIAHEFSDRVKSWLGQKGFFTKEVTLSEFHKAGGSAKCLTLRVPKDAIA